MANNSSAASLKKIFLLTADQLRRLRGHDQQRVDMLDEKRVSALRQATRLADRGAASPGYVTYRDAQARHLAEAARERDQPMAMRVGDETDVLKSRQDTTNSMHEIAAAVAAALAATTTPRAQPGKRKVSRKDGRSGNKKTKRRKVDSGAAAKKRRSEETAPLPPSPPPSPPIGATPWLRLGHSRLQRRL